MENDLEKAIVLWEKGIELDPDSSNYNAAMYYVQKHRLRCIIW